MKIMELELDKEKILLVSKKGFPSRMLSFASRVFCFPIRHRKSAYGFTSRFFSRFEWFFLGFELLSIGLLAAKVYLFGDGLDCIMEAIQNERQVGNQTYVEMSRSFCALYGHPPDLNGTIKNETFIQSLDYFIASGREKNNIKGNLLVLGSFCFGHLLYFSLACQSKKLFGEHVYQLLQLVGITAVVFSAGEYIFIPPSSEIVAAKSSKFFELKASDSLFQLVLKLYRIIWSPIKYTLLAVLVVTIIDRAEQGELEPIELKENKKWKTLFSKLERISKAIRPKEDAKETLKKEDDEKRVNKKPSPTTNWIHSTTFNFRIFYSIVLVFILQLLFVMYLATNEYLIGNRVNCILEGIQNDAQARNETYRELVRNTCGMFGVPPNYMPFRKENDFFFFFLRVPTLFVGCNPEKRTFRMNHDNETFGGRPDYSSIRQDEELDRKHLVLALSFLILLQLLIFQKHLSYLRHLYHPYFKFMVAQIIFLMLILLVLFLCKSLTFGQTRLFSPDRTVFRVERETLPILWYDLPKLKAESQVSLFSYLLSPPKLDYGQYYFMKPDIKNRPIKESIAHQPHSDNKIYHPLFVILLALYVLPWYMLIWSAAVCICVICIVVKLIQIVHLLIHGWLFAYTPRNIPSSEERWNSLLAKLDKMCDAVDKRDREDKESDQKEAALVAVSVTEIDNKLEKTD